MISVRDQIDEGLFVYPATKARLLCAGGSLGSAYFTQCLPKFVGLPLAAAWNIAGMCFLPLDLVLNNSDSSHVLASTTYVLAEKPSS